MEIFIWMYFLLFAIWGISAAMPSRLSRKFSCFGSFLVLWLIQALRSIYTGTDLHSYIPFFHRSSDMAIGYNDQLHFETGYQIYTQLISHYVTLDENVFLAITSFFVIAPISYVIYRFSSKPSLSFIIFASFLIYMFSFSGLRQAIALGLTTFSYIYIDKKKLIPFVLIVLLASTFHTSAILFLLAYPLCNYLNFTPRKYLMVGGIAIGCLFALKSIAIWLVELLFSEGKYVHYLEKETAGAYMLLIALLLLFLFTFYGKGDMLEHLRPLIFVGMIFQSLGLLSSSATRLAYYFYIFIFLALPAVSESRPKSEQQIFNLGIAAFMVFFFFYTTSEGTMGVVPYHFFWE